jgi:methylglutaconyl-CoA hydratase
MAETKSVLMTVYQKVVTITLNRPEVRNAFDESTIDLLNQYLTEVEQNKEVNVLILRGAGENFCSGADIQWMKKMANFTKSENIQDAKAFGQVMNKLNYLSKPSIAVIKGAVYGGGLGLVACCDFALSETTGKFCFAEAKLGLVPSVISPYVVAAMGAKIVRSLMLSAEVFYAADAKAYGLIQEVLPEDKLEQRLQSLTYALLDNGPNAMKIIKHLVHKLQDEKLAPKTLMDYTALLLADVRSSPEGLEGLAAFLAKRKPNWQIH